MTMELSDGQADLLYNTLMALCLQYEEVIEKADIASKKKTYQELQRENIGNHTANIEAKELTRFYIFLEKISLSQFKLFRNSFRLALCEK